MKELTQINRQRLKELEVKHDKTATQAEQLLIAREILECPEVTP